MSPTKRQKRRVAEQADQKRLEADLTGKTELAHVKIIRSSAKAAFSKAKTAAMRMIEEETPAPELKQAMELVQDRYDNYENGLSALDQIYTKRSYEK